MSMGLPETTPASAAAGGVSKKLTRSRGRAKKPVDPYESAYGVIPSSKFGGRKWTAVHELDESMVGKRVQLFGAMLRIRTQSNTRVVLVLQDFCSTVPCVIDASSGQEGVTTRMVRFAVTQPQETPIDVEGVVVPRTSRIATTQKQVEIMVSKIHSIEVGASASRDRTFKSSSITGITPRPASTAVERGVGFQKAGQVVGSGTSIGDQCEILNSIIGEGCKIGKNVVINDSHILGNVIIEDGCKVSHSLICDGVHLRAGAIVESGRILS